MAGEDIGAVGEAMGGAGAARAVEPTHGEGAGGHERPSHCLNCGCALEGEYCHCCGQKAEVHFTIGGLVHDVVHGVLHLDGKFWRTLPMLVWQPGRLTRDYVEGKRARYISPIAFYLFTVVLMFAFVVSASDMERGDVGAVVQEPAATVEAQRERVADLEEALSEVEEDSGPASAGIRAGVASQLRVAERQLEEMEGEPRTLGETDKGTRVTADIPQGGFWDPIRAGVDAAQDNPSLFFYKVQTKAYKLSWLLIPLSLPFMWLLFPFSKRHGLYKHAVFVTYSISFMMLLALNMGFWVWVGAEEVGILTWVFYAPFHLYRQMRGTYKLRRRSALWRTALVSVSAFVVLGIFIGLMIALGALG
ncbi:DUF3667 domain-containing protein [Sphingomicrobium arenosum]|uniref:DUF3667 domain-containing protein n=1 Tax=Sphingomicrobium arenosum TaxID=2233861 RepID=UPI002240EA54|nr:DUF3667 domain-containing protein [Sphingomicrobium arenosum]